MILRCSGLRKSYKGREVVRDVSFEIGAGETFGLLGPNGAGKTTSISMVCGILQRDAGAIEIDGRPLNMKTTSVKGGIGLVPQDLAIYPDLTARENLRFFGKLYGSSRKVLQKRVDEVLEIIGLAERADDRAETYSGGMKRRLNIGIGLLHSPKLLVLDEPTVGVDPQSRNAILTSVERLAGEGMAILYTTHYMEEAERLCDRLGIIDDGQIKAEGTHRELVAIVGEHDRVHLQATGDLENAARVLRKLAYVEEASSDRETIDLIVESASQRLPEILADATSAGAAITGVEVVEPDLEAAFLKLTGKALRD
ncbi:MAG: ABC transporter ATP-binding protein [Actinomycetota bacterium]|nr:ABC transporter ATP-binding protein [Actinomycetota bacterium]